MQTTILVIEDDPAAVRLLELMLRSEEYQILVAADGAQGLEMAQADSPDLIMLDLMLPGQDGFEVLRQLRSESRTVDVPVIVISSRAQAVDKHIATEIGADAYLTKPYERTELLHQVRSLLSGRSGKTAASDSYTAQE